MPCAERASDPAFADAGRSNDIVPKNTASKLSSDTRIIPLVGRRITVIRCIIYASLDHFVIDGRDACRVLLPAWMTENRARDAAVGGDPASVVRRASGALRPRSGPSRNLVASSGTNRTEVNDDARAKGRVGRYHRAFIATGSPRQRRCSVVHSYPEPLIQPMM